MASLQTVDRACAVLFHLAEVGETGPTELAQHLGVSKATAVNLLRSLEIYELVSRSQATRRYQLGAGIYRLVRGSSPMSDLRAVARLPMQRLRDLTGETVTLSIPTRTDRVCIEVFESPHGLRRSVGVGTVTPLHSGATGWVLLAWRPSEEIERFLAGAPFQRVTAQTLTDADSLRAALDQTRAQGYAVRAEDPLVGVRAVAVPVRDCDQHVVAALAVSGPAQRWTVSKIQRHLQAIRHAAEEISGTLAQPVGQGEPRVPPAKRLTNPTTSALQ